MRQAGIWRRARCSRSSTSESALERLDLRRRKIASRARFRRLAGVHVVPPETNIVSITIDELSCRTGGRRSARPRCAGHRHRSALTVRAVTHLDLSAEDAERAAQRLCDTRSSTSSVWRGGVKRALGFALLLARTSRPARRALPPA